ncbi:MAG: metallophosphoesterase [Nanoarchaeota archaeon]|nr:metallophosphoesterase [Nanoarchaeota archaeon]
MENKEVLKYFLEKGLLVDNEVLDLFSGVKDVDFVKLMIEKIKKHTQQKVITKGIFSKDAEQVNKLFLDFPQESQEKLEKLKIKLGLSIEISKEISIKAVKTENFKEMNSLPNIKYALPVPEPNKKIEVKNFVTYFRNRFSEMRNILQDYSQLDNLVSINKISGNRQGISLIGMVLDKRVTKNKNILFEIEDLTGKIKVLVNRDKKELYKKAEEITLDSVVGFKGSGSREILFVNDVIFPEPVLYERKKSSFDENVLFIGDLHYGSKRFLEEGFLRFIDYLNGKVPNTPEVDKIKYLFVVGDLITGVGNYPNQERDLKITDIEEQFSRIANLLGRIRRDIKIIISPGNHDGVRLMEPQPVIDEKYAWPLYNLKNVILTTNPAQVNIGAKQDFSGFDVLTYHGFSYFHYAKTIPHLVKKKAINNAELIMSYLLKNRHLAPTHASTQYYPLEKDAHIIRDIPDVFVSAHTHKSSVSYYNNILMISTSCWEAMTPYQEKFGNTPDHCKVPMFNLKTRAVKVLDFE